MACFKIVPHSFMDLPMRPRYTPFSRRCSWEPDPEFLGGLLPELNSFLDDRDLDSSLEAVLLSLLHGNSRKRRCTEMLEPCKKKMKKSPVKTPWVQIMRLEGFSASNITAKMTGDNTLVLTAKRRLGDEEAGYDEVQRVRYIRVPKDVDTETVKLEWREEGLVRVSGKRVEETEKALEEGKDAEEKQTPSSAENSKPSSPEVESIETSDDAPDANEMSETSSERCGNDKTPSAPEAEKDVKFPDENTSEDGEEHQDGDRDTEKTLAIAGSHDTPLSTRKPGEEFCGGCVVERAGAKHFKLSLDLKDYGADDVKVRGEGNILTISGEQKKETDSFQWQSHFSRSWTLPRDVNLDQVESEMKGGKLDVFAPIVTDSDSDIKTVEEEDCT